MSAMFENRQEGSVLPWLYEQLILYMPVRTTMEDH